MCNQYIGINIVIIFLSIQYYQNLSKLQLLQLLITSRLQVLIAYFFNYILKYYNQSRLSLFSYLAIIRDSNFLILKQFLFFILKRKVVVYFKDNNKLNSLTFSLNAISNYYLSLLPSQIILRILYYSKAIITNVCYK